MEADKDGDGKLSFEEFALMVSNTVRFEDLLCLPRVVGESGRATRRGHAAEPQSFGRVGSSLSLCLGRYQACQGFG